MVESGSPIPLEELSDLERLLQTAISAAGRIDPDRPLTEQDLGELDIGLDRFSISCASAPACASSPRC